MAITAKSTKAQLLQHIEELEISHQAISIALLQAQPTPIREQAARVINEIIALAEDTYRFGAWCRKGFDRVLTELRTLSYK